MLMLPAVLLTVVGCMLASNRHAIIGMPMAVAGLLLAAVDVIPALMKGGVA